MKVVILAGGFGTRLSEETSTVPKPMVEIGGKPIIWHIMKSYSIYGFNEFIILLGYKGYMIKEYFANYFLHQSDVTIDLANNNMQVHDNSSEPWKVTLLETGIDTQTGGRILKAKPYIGEESFMLTYGDGVSDINIVELIKFHKAHGKIATVSSIQPDGRFGTISAKDGGRIESFKEKPVETNFWINAGFFVCHPQIFDYFDNSDQLVFEKSPIENLVKDGELFAYKHTGFWKCMDTLRDKTSLCALWDSGKAPWKKW